MTETGGDRLIHATRQRYRLRDVTNAPAEAWDALAVRSPLGETLQSHAWGELKRREGWRPLRYRLDDAAGAVAVVSFQEKPLAAGILRRLPLIGGGGRREPGGRGRSSSALDGLAGRFLYAPVGPVLLRPTPAAARAALAAVRRVARTRRAALVVIDPAWEEGGPLALVLPGAGFRPAAAQIQVSRTAMLVPLRENEAAQHALVNDRVARSINKARRAGVGVRRVDEQTPVDERERAFHEMYDILEATAERRSFGLRERSFLLYSVRELVTAGHASVWFADHAERAVATTLLHHSGDRAVLFLAGARDEEERRKVPSNFLLQWEIMRWAVTRGFCHYDLGGVDTPAAPGMPADDRHQLWSLFEFKRQWGARPVLHVGAYDAATLPFLGTAARGAAHLRQYVRGLRQVVDRAAGSADGGRAG